MKSRAFTEIEDFFFYNLAWGGTLLTYLLTLFAIFKRGRILEVHEHASYVLLFGVFPFLLFSVGNYLNGKPNRFIRELLFVLNGIFFLSISLGIVLVTIISGTSMLRSGNYRALFATICALVSCHFLIITGIFTTVSKGNLKKLYKIAPYIQNGNRYVALLLLASLFLLFTALSPFNPEEGHFNFILSQIIESPGYRFGFFIGFSIYAYILFWRGERIDFKNRKFKLVAIFCVFIVVLTLDDSLITDNLSYSPYLGSAISFLHGGLPLVDTFSTYGIAPSLIMALFLKLFQPHIYSAAFAVRILNTIYLLLYLFLIARLCGRKSILLLAGLFVILFHQLNGYNLNLTPSTGGFRYLPCVLFLLILTRLPRDRKYSVASLLVLVVSSFWSIETFLFTLIPYIGFLILRGMLVHRQNVYSDVLSSFGVLFGACFCAHFLFSVLIFLKSSQWPQYDIYLELVGAFSNASNNAAWQVEIPATFFSWGAVAITYLISICYAVSVIFKRNQAKIDWIFINTIFPLTLFGVLQASYFVGRSYPAILTFSLLPFAPIVIFSFSKIIKSPQDYAMIRTPALIILCFSVSITTARIWDTLNCTRNIAAGNCMLLTGIMTQKGTAPLLAFEQLFQKLEHPPHDDRYNLVGKNISIVEDSISLANKWTKNQERLPLFVPGGLTNIILLYTGKANQISMNEPSNDIFSQTLYRKLLEQTKLIPIGTVVVSYPKIKTAYEDSILEKSNLCLLEMAPSGVAASRISYKNEPCKATYPSQTL